LTMATPAAAATERGIVDDIKEAWDNAAGKVAEGVADAGSLANKGVADAKSLANKGVADAKSLTNKATDGVTDAVEIVVGDVPGKLDSATTPTATHRPGYWCSFMIVASAVLLGSSTRYAGDDHALGDYAVSVAAVSLGLGILMMLWYLLLVTPL